MGFSPRFPEIHASAWAKAHPTTSFVGDVDGLFQPIPQLLVLELNPLVLGLQPLEFVASRPEQGFLNCCGMLIDRLSTAPGFASPSADIAPVSNGTADPFMASSARNPD